MKNQIKEDKLVITKCRGETYEEAEKRNQHFIDVGRKQALEEVKKIIDELHDKYAGTGRLKVELLKELKSKIKKEMKKHE